MKRAMVMAVLAMAVVGAGCAKQPADMMSGASASGAGYDSAQSGMTGMTARPDVREYVASADLPDVHFDFDKYDIRPDAARILEASARWLKAHEKAQLLIEGHCDPRGTSEYNVVLGERRAKAAMNYLVSRGIDARRIAVVSYGEDKPQCIESTEKCWAKNRRAHFLYKSE